MSSTDFDCQTCGACCAHFRVSFYWGEADDAPGGTVPVGLTQKLTPYTRCMQGTSSRTPRCVALSGEIGQQVGCTIYPLRASTCHALQAGDAQCIKARLAHGLSTLQEAAWVPNPL